MNYLMTSTQLMKTSFKFTLQNWFDAEIMENISDTDKLFKKFKKSRLHVDKDNYKEARNEVQKLIRTKKKAYV